MTTAFDRTPFGHDLAQGLWLRLMQMWLINGLRMNGISIVHRDYCGHGLIRVEEGVELTDIWDGMPSVAWESWSDANSFVEFWSRQSAFSCSGHDASALSIFLHGKCEYPDNPRINRARLEGTLKNDTQHFWDQNFS